MKAREAEKQIESMKKNHNKEILEQEEQLKDVQKERDIFKQQNKEA